MSHLLLLTRSTQSSVEVLPALALLPHHVKILPAEASALIDSARDQSSAAVEDVRRRCDELLSHFEQHRRRGSQLVWDAFNRDLGGEH